MKKRHEKKSDKKNFFKKINFRILFPCLVAVFAAEIIGGFFTSSNVETIWYLQTRPHITPPNWVFPIVWNVLFFLISLSLYFSWIKSDKEQKKNILTIFGINLVLNVLWSFLFFVLRSPTAAFFELIVLWLSIFPMIILTYKIDKKSAYLLFPYALWVGYAGVLNFITVFGEFFLK